MRWKRLPLSRASTCCLSGPLISVYLSLLCLFLISLGNRSPSDTATGNNIGQPILNGVVTDELKAAIARVLAAAHKAGKKCGIYCANGAQAKASAAQGFDMINVATDYTSLEALVKEELSVASSQAKPERGVSY